MNMSAKWMLSFLAFIFAALAVSSLTTNVFLNASLGSFDAVKASIGDKVKPLVDDDVKQFYAQLTAGQKQEVEQIKSLTTEQRKQLIDPCKEPDKKDQPFCNPGFISGQLSFDGALRENRQQAYQQSLSQAFDQLKEKIAGYASYPLFLIGIAAIFLSLLAYSAVNGVFGGVQIFSGNIAWLSFLSAVSFKTMPSFIDRLLLTVQQQNGGSASASSVIKDITFSWLVPAMNAAFWLAVWIMIPTAVIWIGMKIYRNYDVSFR